MAVGNIRNTEDYLNNLIPWDRLNGAFPRGIAPTDVDGMVEASNQFLFFEAKRHGEELKKGQRMALQRLARLSDAITVIVLHWEPSTNELEEFYEILSPNNILGRGWDELRKFCKDWST